MTLTLFAALRFFGVSTTGASPSFLRPFARRTQPWDEGDDRLEAELLLGA